MTANNIMMHLHLILEELKVNTFWHKDMPLNMKQVLTNF